MHKWQRTDSISEEVAWNLKEKDKTSQFDCIKLHEELHDEASKIESN